LTEYQGQSYNQASIAYGVKCCYHDFIRDCGTDTH